MPVLLASGLGCIGFDVRLDRLNDRCRLRADDALAEHLRSALPGYVFGGIDAFFVYERFIQMAVSALERPDERSFLRPALPFLVLLFHFIGVGLVVTDAGGFDYACH